jgi:hypothetical protein
MTWLYRSTRAQETTRTSHSPRSMGDRRIGGPVQRRRRGRTASGLPAGQQQHAERHGRRHGRGWRWPRTGPRASSRRRSAPPPATAPRSSPSGRSPWRSPTRVPATISLAPETVRQRREQELADHDARETGGKDHHTSTSTGDEGLGLDVEAVHHGRQAADQHGPTHRRGVEQGYDVNVRYPLAGHARRHFSGLPGRCGKVIRPRWQSNISRESWGPGPESLVLR